MPGPIEFYFDFMSPFAYVGSIVVERLATRHGREVVWRPLLVGVTVQKIMGLPPIPSIPLKGPYLQHDLGRLSAYFDVPLSRHGLEGVNSVAAFRVFLAIAEDDPVSAKRFAQAVFHRLWRSGRDITAPRDALEVAREIGLDADALQSVSEGQAARTHLRTAVEDAIAAGVFGVPTFVADGELFWGNDHIWMLDHWLERGSFAP